VVRDPIREWREQYARHRLGIDFKPLSDGPFTAIFQPIFEELRIVRNVLSPGVNFRDAELVKDGNDSFALLITQSKNIHITHQGRDLNLSRGDATLLHVCATGSVGSPETFGYISALIPFAELVARVPRFDDAITRRVPRRSEALQLTRTYLRALAKGCFGREGRQTIRAHMVDLVALAITPHGALGESSLSAVTTARLGATFAYIAEHFEEPQFNIGAVARSQGVSPRYLQRLLEATGTCFTARVNELRLQRAVTLLTETCNGKSRITDITLQAGFSDISHFNRLFRSRFGGTPSDVRAEAHKISIQEVMTSEHCVGRN
jgi:AraC-like DNA-binding protein